MTGGAAGRRDEEIVQVLESLSEDTRRPALGIRVLEHGPRLVIPYTNTPRTVSPPCQSLVCSLPTGSIKILHVLVSISRSVCPIISQNITESIKMKGQMDVDSCIRENIPWAKLPEDIRARLGNANREYDKMILEYSIKNQLRYKGNLGESLFFLRGISLTIPVRYVKKNEETYYDMVMKYSESHLMLFPYHLADIIVRELRITPFNYYINIITVTFPLFYEY